MKETKETKPQYVDYLSECIDKCKIYDFIVYFYLYIINELLITLLYILISFGFIAYQPF